MKLNKNYKKKINFKQINLKKKLTKSINIQMMKNMMKNS